MIKQVINIQRTSFYEVLVHMSPILIMNRTNLTKSRDCKKKACLQLSGFIKSTKPTCEVNHAQALADMRTRNIGAINFIEIFGQVFGQII